METGKLKLALSAGALALSMALAGCGGSSSGGGPGANSEGQETRTPYDVAKLAIENADTPEAVQEAYDALDKDDVTGTQAAELEMLVKDRRAALTLAAAVEAANSAVAALATPTQMLIDDANTAIKDVTDLDSDYDTTAWTAGVRTARVSLLAATASAAVDAIDVTKQATPTQMLINDANTAIKAVTDLDSDYDTAAWQGVITAATKYLADQGQLAAQKKMLDDAQEVKDKADDAAKLADAKALFSAFSAPTSRVNVNAGHAGLTFKPKRGGVTTVASTLFDTKVDDAEQGKGGKELPSVGEWSGTKVSATTQDSGPYPAETVVYYSNIGPDTEVAFTTEHASKASGQSWHMHPKLIAGTDFGRENDPKTHDEDEEVEGRFDGTPGTYTCDATQCTSQIGENDEGIRLSNNWDFKPTNPDALVKKADSEYASFGWWLEKTSATQFEVSTFHQFTDGSLTTPDASLTGTAKYVGPAAGVFAMVHSSSEGPTHTSGDFTATADLTADFDDANKVTGSIKDFSVGTKWMVKVDSSGANDGTAVWHIGDNESAAAVANSEFHHSFHEETGGVPMTLTGAWKTQFEPEEGTATGYMAGAFGATKQ